MQIGWSEINITPKKKIKLAGQFYERISAGIHSPICAVAMAISTQNDHAVFCACDLENIYPNLLELVRRTLKGPWQCGNGPDPQKVIISATHTHNSFEYKSTSRRDSSLNILGKLLPPTMQYVPKITDNDVMTDSEALYFIADKISEAILDAWTNMEEGYFANGFGRAAVGMCRRVSYDDGSALMWGETNTANFECLEGGNDSGIELLYTFNKDKKCTGVVVNVACPAQVMEHRSVISADYWGAVRDFARKKFGVHFKVLGLCSAAGDQCPRDLIRWVEPETPIDDPNVIRMHPLLRKADPSMYDEKGCRLVGRRIANEIFSAIEEISEIQSDEGFAHKVIALKLPVRRVTVNEYNNAVEMLREYIETCEKTGKFTFQDNANMHVCAGVIARYEYQQRFDLYPVEMHVMRLGDIAFATNSFELFLDYGNKIRARSTARQTFLIQLCCGADGYLPTEKAENGGHYSAYVSSGVVGHEGGDLLVRYTLDEIKKLF